MIRWRPWPLWTALCLVAYIYLAVAVWPQEDASSDVAAGLIPITVRSRLRLLRDTVIRPQLPYPQSVIIHALELGRWLE